MPSRLFLPLRQARFPCPHANASNSVTRKRVLKAAPPHPEQLPYFFGDDFGINHEGIAKPVSEISMANWPMLF